VNPLYKELSKYGKLQRRVGASGGRIEPVLEVLPHHNQISHCGPRLNRDAANAGRLSLVLIARQVFSQAIHTHQLTGAYHSLPFLIEQCAAAWAQLAALCHEAFRIDSFDTTCHAEFFFIMYWYPGVIAERGPTFLAFLMTLIHHVNSRLYL
jgi:hypothetical protein